LDLVFVLQSRRRREIPNLVVVTSQVVLAGLAVTVFFADEGMAALALWAMLAIVNASLATLGLANQRTLAIVGFAGTLAAVVLIGLRSFGSLPVIVIAAAFCLASALLPAPRATSPSQARD